MSEHIDGMLQAYLDEELGPEERAEVEQRLASDASLREELRRLSLARDAVMALPTVAPPGDLAEQVLQRARETAPTSTAAPPQASWKVAAAIALLLLLPGGGFAAGYRVGTGRTLPAQVVEAPAGDGQSDFLVLLHGEAGVSELEPEQRSWREELYSNWADSVQSSGRLVRADDFTDDGQGMWADGNAVEVQQWFATPWVVPTKAYVVRAWNYDEALELARTSPHLEFGGSLTVRRITEGP